jgi:hypothetical protein
VEAPGIEAGSDSSNALVLGSIRDRMASGKATQSDRKCAIPREPVTARDSSEAPAADPVEAALGEAIALAAKAGRWDAVTELGRVLAERRRSAPAPGVASLDAVRAKRGGPR